VTGDDALSAFTFVEDLVAELGGGPLPPDVAAEVRRRVGGWVTPMLDWEARMRILIESDVRDLAAGKAVLLADGEIWRGDDVHLG
jgi:hypothetical protein